MMEPRQSTTVPNTSNVRALTRKGFEGADIVADFLIAAFEKGAKLPSAKGAPKEFVSSHGDLLVYLT